MEKYLEAGKIVNTHGVAGYVRIESWCDSPRVLASLRRLYIKESDGSFRELKAELSSVHKGMALTRFEGISDLDGAISLKNRVVYADRADLPLKKGDNFIADLIGLPLIDAVSGKKYGVLREVINRGASDVYVVDTPDGEAMMPAVPEFVDRIEPESGIYVRPIPGMFDEAEKA